MTKEIDDGVIKFSFENNENYSIKPDDITQIELIRSKLFKKELIGEYRPQNIGFGNLSIRFKNNSFIISGTQTGKFSNLNTNQYSIVEDADLDAMKIYSKGKIAPSSESLTHFAIYSSCPQINTILHIHNGELWNHMLNNDYIKTRSDINYGTSDMAYEAKRCIQDNIKGIFVMSGHEDGIIAYGQSVSEAYKEIEDLIIDSGIKL